MFATMDILDFQCVEVVDVPQRVQLLLNVISLACVRAKRTMMVRDVTGADWVTTAIQDVSNVLVTLEVQFTSSVIQTQGSVTAKEVSVVLTVIGVLADIMGFLIVKLVSAILLGLSRFQMDNWLTVPYQMKANVIVRIMFKVLPAQSAKMVTSFFKVVIL